MNTRMPIAAMTSCAMVNVTVIPSFFRVARSAGLRRRKRTDRDGHAVYRDDLDLATAGDADLRGRGKDLDSSVIGKADRATRPGADADGDDGVTSDELAQRGRPPALGTTQRGKDAQGGRRTRDAEPEGDEQLSERVLLQRGAEQTADPVHREETEEDRRRGRVIATQKRKMHPEQSRRDAQPATHTEAGEDQERGPEQCRAGEDQLQVISAHGSDRQLSRNAVLHRYFQHRAYRRASKSYAVLESMFREMDCAFSAASRRGRPARERCEP